MSAQRLYALPALRALNVCPPQAGEGSGLSLCQGRDGHARSNVGLSVPRKSRVAISGCHLGLPIPPALNISAVAVEWLWYGGQHAGWLLSRFVFLP